MSRKRWIGALALVAVLGVSAVAIAAGGGPQIEQVAADITYTHARVDFRICNGPGGEIDEERVRLTGTSEGDARLTGNVVVTLHVLNEIETGESTQQGRLVIRDPETGRKKAVASVNDAGFAEIFQGSLVGSLKPGGGNLVANWRTTFHENGAVTAQIGGEAADGRLPAIVTSGRCKGKFERVEVDFPSPEEELLRTRALGGNGAGWRYR